ncbi:MAG: spore germination protein [Firmicutes bacterium]|nr:spore germination protein [Bacillota bacterium]
MADCKKISACISDNIGYIADRFHSKHNKDIILREFKSAGGVRCFLAYIDGMADSDAINDFIMRPIMLYQHERLDKQNVLHFNNCEITDSLDEAVMAILQGDTPVFVDGDATCAICETKGFERRSVSTPLTEAVVTGSQEAFNENVRTNITLIRRAMKTADLCTEFVSTGTLSGEKCAVLYISGVTNKRLVNEVKRRLKNISGDYISGSGMVSQMISDCPRSIFPTILSTERPERAAHYIAGGRVAVICDNSPFALIMPVTLPLLLDSPESNQQRWQNGTYSRLIRIFAFFCTTMLSGIYIALIGYHHEMIPTELLTLIAESRKNLPFSSVTELIVMEILFELVREAGLRVPSALGGAIGTVGGLILGTAAIDAGIVSPVTLIVVAVSGIGNAALPDYELAFGMRFIKLYTIILGAAFGIIGVALSTVSILALLVHDYSFDERLLTVQAIKWSAGTNMFWQRPVYMQEMRPHSLHAIKPRQQPDLSRKWDGDNK